MAKRKSSVEAHEPSLVPAVAAKRQRLRRFRDRTDLGSQFSEGARQLWLYSAANGITLNAMNWKAEFATARMYMYAFGDHLPNLHSAFRIKDLFGIDPRLFITKPKRPFVVPITRPARPTLKRVA